MVGKVEHSYALANPPSPAMESSVDISVTDSMQGNFPSGITQSSNPKKAKLSDDFAIVDNDLSSSPVLHREHQGGSRNCSSILMVFNI